MLHKWKLLKSEWALNEKWYKVRKDTLEIKPGKVIDDYYMGVFDEVAMILAVTLDRKVVFVQQYRHAVGEILTELPAGFIENNDDPLKTARRELREETGYVSDNWQKLGYFYKSTGKGKGNNIHIYLAKNAEETADQEFDETEDIEVILKPFSEALAMAKSGGILGIDSVLGLLLAEEKLD